MSARGYPWEPVRASAVHAWQALGLSDVPAAVVGAGEQAVRDHLRATFCDPDHDPHEGDHPVGGWRELDVGSTASQAAWFVVLYRDLEGRPHRDDGPAAISYDQQGFAVRALWNRHGRTHRADGPALSYRSGTHRFYVDAHQIGEHETQGDSGRPARSRLRRWARASQAGSDTAVVVDDLLAEDLLGEGAIQGQGVGARALAASRQGLGGAALLAVATRAAPASWAAR